MLFIDAAGVKNRPVGFCDTGLGMLVWQDMPSMCGMMNDSWGRNWYQDCMTSERDIPESGRCKFHPNTKLRDRPAVKYED